MYHREEISCMPKILFVAKKKKQKTKNEIAGKCTELVKIILSELTQKDKH